MAQVISVPHRRVASRSRLERARAATTPRAHRLGELYDDSGVLAHVVSTPSPGGPSPRVPRCRRRSSKLDHGLFRAANASCSMCMTVQTSDHSVFRLLLGDAGTRSDLNESHRPILSDASSLHVPLLRHPRFSRRARSGGMSRIALVTARRQADNDKTRVSSIDKRRVTPVPEEGAASTEASCCWARPSGLERSWTAPLEV